MPAYAAAAAKLLQSCPTLCDPIDGSPPGSTAPGILQARTLEWVAILLQCMKVKSESEVAQLCLTVRDPMDCSLPDSSVHGIFQARVLEWVAIAFSTCLCRESHFSNQAKRYSVDRLNFVYVAVIGKWFSFQLFYVLNDFHSRND